MRVRAEAGEPKEVAMSERRAEVRGAVEEVAAVVVERLVEGPDVLDWPLEMERVEGGVALWVGRHRVLLEGEALGRLRAFLAARRGAP